MSLLLTRLCLIHCWAPNALPHLKPTFDSPGIECLLCVCLDVPVYSRAGIRRLASGSIVRQFGSLAVSKETKPLNPANSCLF